MPAAQRTGPATSAAPAAIRRARLPVERSSTSWLVVGERACVVMVVILFVRSGVMTRTLLAAPLVPDPSRRTGLAPPPGGPRDVSASSSRRITRTAYRTYARPHARPSPHQPAPVPSRGGAGPGRPRRRGGRSRHRVPPQLRAARGGGRVVRGLVRRGGLVAVVGRRPRGVLLSAHRSA